MKLSVTIAAMVEGGCSAEQIAAVVYAHEAQDEARREAKREANATRQRAKRERDRVTTVTRDSALQRVTACDTPPPDVSPKDNISNPLPNPPHTPRRKGAEREFSAEFDEFWSAYPRRPNNPKDPARKRFDAIRSQGVGFSEIIAGTRAYAASVSGNDPRYTAQAVTWLNQRRWQDDYSTTPKAIIARPEPDRTGQVWVSRGTDAERAWEQARGSGFLAARRKDRNGYPDGGYWLPSEFPTQATA